MKGGMHGFYHALFFIFVCVHNFNQKNCPNMFELSTLINRESNPAPSSIYVTHYPLVY